MEICLQAALRLNSVASFSGLAGFAYLKSGLFFCLVYNIISQTVLPLSTNLGLLRKYTD